MGDLVSEGSVETVPEKSGKIEFDAEQRESFIKTSLELKHILNEDKGKYIINVLKNITGSDPNIIKFDYLVQYLGYNYKSDIVNLVLEILLNPPTIVYEIKEIINDVSVNDFLDKIKEDYGYEIQMLYSYRVGKSDWHYIKSDPIIREDGIALTVEVILSSGESVSFTAPLKTLPRLTHHFIKHMNRTVDLLKDRALVEISIEEIRKTSAELVQLIERLEKTEEAETNDGEGKADPSSD